MISALRWNGCARTSRSASPNPAATAQRWQRLPDLASVRDAAALAKLPADERQGWQQFWADVAELRKQAEAK